MPVATVMGVLLDRVHSPKYTNFIYKSHYIFPHAHVTVGASDMNQGDDPCSPLLIVTPAQTGVQVPEARFLLPWVPAFAGMTEQGAGIKCQIGITSDAPCTNDRPTSQFRALRHALPDCPYLGHRRRALDDPDPARPRHRRGAQVSRFRTLAGRHQPQHLVGPIKAAGGSRDCRAALLRAAPAARRIPIDGEGQRAAPSIEDLVRLGPAPH